MPPALIERYRDRLPLEEGDPVVTLNEGSTPLIEAERLSERLGVRALLKFEGANPTGSFKDRGMTVAVSRAKARGAEAVICASTGNTAASAAAYAARAGLRGAVIVPEGKIAIGKLAQALMHGARVDRPAGQLRRGAANRPRPRRAASDRARQLGQPVPDRGPEDRRLRGDRGDRGGARRARDPGRQRRQRHRLLAGIPGDGRRSGPLRLPGRGRRAAGPRRRGREPGDGRLGDPDRQPGPLGGGDGRLHRLPRPGRRGLRRADPRRLPLARRQRGCLLRARLGRLRRRPARARDAGRSRASSRPSRSSASSPATASRTPTPRSRKRRRWSTARTTSRPSSARYSHDGQAPDRAGPGLLGQPRAGLRRDGGGAGPPPRARDRRDRRVLVRPRPARRPRRTRQPPRPRLRDAFTRPTGSRSACARGSRSRAASARARRRSSPASSRPITSSSWRSRARSCWRGRRRSRDTPTTSPPRSTAAS